MTFLGDEIAEDADHHLKRWKNPESSLKPSVCNPDWLVLEVRGDDARLVLESQLAVSGCRFLGADRAAGLALEAGGFADEDSLADAYDWFDSHR